jgi:hypothetical protein
MKEELRIKNYEGAGAEGRIKKDEAGKIRKDEGRIKKQNYELGRPNRLK